MHPDREPAEMTRTLGIEPQRLGRPAIAAGLDE